MNERNGQKTTVPLCYWDTLLYYTKKYDSNQVHSSKNDLLSADRRVPYHNRAYAGLLFFTPCCGTAVCSPFGFCGCIFLSEGLDNALKSGIIRIKAVMGRSSVFACTQRAAGWCKVAAGISRNTSRSCRSNEQILFCVGRAVRARYAPGVF